VGATPGQPRSGSRRLPARPKLPLWLQWTLSLLVAAVAIVLLVRFVDAQSTPQAQAPHISAKGARILNREAEILDAQEQAPMVSHFAAGVTVTAAIEHAIASYMTTEINFDRLDGPLRATLCFPVSTAAARVAFRCSALARSTSYPFVGVVDPATRTVVYCRHNPPPERGDRIPLSRRCLR
jgi:hypothetical protein